jgi:hypothetical protein
MQLAVSAEPDHVGRHRIVSQDLVGARHGEQASDLLEIRPPARLRPRRIEAGPASA